MSENSGTYANAHLCDEWLLALYNKSLPKTNLQFLYVGGKNAVLAAKTDVVITQEAAVEAGKIAAAQAKKKLEKHVKTPVVAEVDEGDEEDEDEDEDDDESDDEVKQCLHFFPVSQKVNVLVSNH